MSFWETSGGAAVIDAAAGALDSAFGGSSAGRQDYNHRLWNRENYQHAIRWRVADAREAGINPRIALGAPSASPSAAIGGQSDRGSIFKDAAAAYYAQKAFQQQGELNEAQAELLREQAAYYRRSNPTPGTGDQPSRLAVAAGLAAGTQPGVLPSAVEPAVPTTQAGGQAVLQPQDINLVDIFKAPRKYTQEQVEQLKGGVVAEAFGLWKSLHEISDYRERQRVFNQKGRSRGFKLDGGFKVLTRRGWREVK